MSYSIETERNAIQIFSATINMNNILIRLTNKLS